MNKIEFETIEEIIHISGIAQIISDNAAIGYPLVVSGVPEKWLDDFRSHGFREYAHYKDYWIDTLIPLDNFYNCYDFLRSDECADASEITIACDGQSRGFEGTPPDWFALWLRGEDEGQTYIDCQNAAILTHRISGKIAGVSCTATYDHDSEKGTVVWVRMLAVHPDFQGHGIGKKLLMQTLQYGAECGAKRAFLHADTQNTIAIKIYANAGFTPREGENQIDMIWRESNEYYKNA